MIPDPLDIAAIHAGFQDGSLTPTALAVSLLDRIDAYEDEAVFIHRIPRAAVLAEAAAASRDLAAKPLAGIPFVVKDNMDVAGLPTTAACPDFAYVAARDAVCVARLREAGAILLGKANMDQFATGLNGTRSPYGAPRSVFGDGAYISGGSSSGSAVAVGAGLAVFSLGTDTAGSGRVPAAFNNLIGLKPTIGRIATTGIVPASQSLDCVSVFANSAADALAVLAVAEGADEGDPYSRLAQDIILPEQPKAGYLRPSDRIFDGDDASAALYEAALANAAALGWQLQEFDYAPFREVAAALYGTAYIAERLAAIRPFYRTKPEALHPVIRSILDGAATHDAADAFTAIHLVQAARRRAEAELAKLDLLLLPTAPTIFTVEQMLAAPVAANARLGLYTNFVNFMDLAAVALPAGFRPDGLPFGVSLIGPAFSDASLAAYADALHAALGAGAGKTKAKSASRVAPPARPEITLVVAGAHLSGMVLNHELVASGGRLLRATRTAPDYRLFALATTPPKPGLVRAPGFAGEGIEVELWSLPPTGFARFVAALPPPMGIGKVTLADGSEHPGFLCEAHVLEGARDITAFGGWRAFRAAATPPG